MPITINGKTYTFEEWEKKNVDKFGPKGTPIPVDEQAILALQKVSTGADIHDTNMLIGNYKSFCHDGRQEWADKYKRAMYERAIRLQKGR